MLWFYIFIEAKCDVSALQTTENNIGTEISQISSDIAVAYTARTNLRKTIDCVNNLNGEFKYKSWIFWIILLYVIK